MDGHGIGSTFEEQTRDRMKYEAREKPDGSGPTGSRSRAPTPTRPKLRSWPRTGRHASARNVDDLELYSEDDR